MKNVIIKYLLIIFASFLSSIALKGILMGLEMLLRKSIVLSSSDFIWLIIFVFLLLMFSFLAYKYNNKYSIYAIIVTLITAIFCLGIESFDYYFTNNYLITNGWINLFGWYKFDSGEAPMAHRVFGFLVIIYPLILTSCSIFFYWLLLKKQHLINF